VATSELEDDLGDLRAHSPASLQQNLMRVQIQTDDAVQLVLNVVGSEPLVVNGTSVLQIDTAPGHKIFLATDPTSTMTKMWLERAEGQRQYIISAVGYGRSTVHRRINRDELRELTYLQVKGTGLANRCPEVVGTNSIPAKAGSQIVDFCLEPKAWQVEEEVVNRKGQNNKRVSNTKLMTRETYTLHGMSGSIGEDSQITFNEEDGIDYAPTTVQLPGGERVPFLFTAKDLVAKGSGTNIEPGFSMQGAFKVPSYRTGRFLDPKGRGTATGYDQAVALPDEKSDVDEKFEVENNKKFEVREGSILMQVTQVAEAGEIGGVFVSTQDSDTDLGSKTPKKVVTKGIFYFRIEKQ